MLTALLLLCANFATSTKADSFKNSLDVSNNDSTSTSDGPLLMPLCNGIDIEDATVGDLQRWMTLGQLSSQDIVSCYLARIDQTNP